MEFVILSHTQTHTLFSLGFMFVEGLTTDLNMYKMFVRGFWQLNSEETT